jgi:hypothetical protein
MSWLRFKLLLRSHSVRFFLDDRSGILGWVQRILA